MRLLTKALSWAPHAASTVLARARSCILRHAVLKVIAAIVASSNLIRIMCRRGHRIPLWLALARHKERIKALSFLCCAYAGRRGSLSISYTSLRNPNLNHLSSGEIGWLTI